MTTFLGLLAILGFVVVVGDIIGGAVIAVVERWLPGE